MRRLRERSAEGQTGVGRRRPGPPPTLAPPRPSPGERGARTRLPAARVSAARPRPPLPPGSRADLSRLLRGSNHHPCCLLRGSHHRARKPAPPACGAPCSPAPARTRGAPAAALGASRVLSPPSPRAPSGPGVPESRQKPLSARPPRAGRHSGARRVRRRVGGAAGEGSEAVAGGGCGKRREQDPVGRWESRPGHRMSRPRARERRSGAAPRPEGIWGAASSGKTRAALGQLPASLGTSPRLSRAWPLCSEAKPAEGGSLPEGCLPAVPPPRAHVGPPPAHLPGPGPQPVS